MCNPEKVLAFLDITSPAGWDPSIAVTIISALAVAIPAFQFELPTSTLTKPKTTRQSIPNAITTTHLLGGSMLFGAGWGMYGL
jgi:hypothetical protein